MSSDELRTLVSGMNYAPKTLIFGSCAPRKVDNGTLLSKDGDALIVLFGGGTKRRQQTDIERAKALHAEYKARKTAARSEDKPKRPRR